MSMPTVSEHQNLHYVGRDIPWLLKQWSETKPNHAFLIWEPADGNARQWTYREFYQQTRALAAGLYQQGVRLGDRVLIHMDNCPEFLLSWYACAHLGAVAVTTNTRSAPAEVAYFAEHSEVVAAITQPSLAQRVKDNAPNLKWIAVTDHNAGEQATRQGSWLAFETLLESDAGIPEREAQPLLDLGIQYTSGTTSRPKAVVWTHANALWGAQVNAEHESLSGDDVHMTFLPLFHANAQGYSVLASLWQGATVVLMPKFSAGRFWEVSLKRRCTWCSLIPFCIKALATRSIPEEHFYHTWATGASIPEVEALFKVKLIGWWGMTETISHPILTSTAHPSPRVSMGRPAPEYGVAIVNNDNQPVATGETGHLLIKGIPGVSLFKEYLKNPQATQDSYDENGWFRTGDRVTLTASGDIFFTDRDKDMLKVGGENVAASEIERVINQVPAVNEVAVVSKPHKMLDEVPVAFVIAHKGFEEDIEQTIMDNCQQNLADFKQPHQIILVNELPRSLLEKINKAALREKLVSNKEAVNG